MSPSFEHQAALGQQLLPLFDRSLQTRSLSPEIMDDRSLDFFELEAALDSLQRFNRIALTAKKIWQLIRQRPGELTLFDIGCGGGDILFELEKQAGKEGRRFKGLGLDWNGKIIAAAKKKAALRNSCLQFKQFNAIKDELPEDFDLAISSLFLHHLSDAEVISLIRRTSKKVKQLVISDLARSKLNYILTMAGTRLLSKSKIVHIDGPLSVRAAFTVREMEIILKESGLNRFDISRQFPGRLFVSIITENETAAISS
jgi:2-polyprenyl-3-methyl-5-hydroxy-6-metoxy-1,4-benzoquinol methylase